MITDAKTLANIKLLEIMPGIPDVYWISGDDLCNCTFQRIGDWTNPYLGQTLRVRMCCIWAEIYKQYPQFVQEIPAFYDQNRHVWDEAHAWDSEEMDMPIALWHRQLARRTGKSIDEIRVSANPYDRPKKVAKGQGWESKNKPTEEEVAYARQEQLKAAGWIIDESKNKW